MTHYHGIEDQLKSHFTPGKVYIKKAEKPLGCATAMAIIVIGLVAGIAAGWFLYGIVGLGR